LIYIPSYIKINLTLRVFVPRDDGYHEISTLFHKLGPIEWLGIRRLNGTNRDDIINSHNIEISGTNIISRAIEFLRSKSVKLPPIECNIWKVLPVGSGIGAGSGNGAALLEWASTIYDLILDPAELAKFGADIPFFLSKTKTALATGVGERLKLLDPLTGIYALLAIPNIKISTAEAYRELDESRKRGEAEIVPVSFAIYEALNLYADLEKKRRIGFLPNDFVTVLRKKSDFYDGFFDLCNSTFNNSLAWGLSGSGSSVFCLFTDKHEAIKAQELVSSKLECDCKTFVLE
jgi:4-diphosphocytidyl-2-C-methyl-D-erythritol kinase